MSDKDGGPAFPRNYERDGHNGMTLRDYFAALSMAGFLANTDLDNSFAQNAEIAYKMADAMLKEREK